MSLKFGCNQCEALMINGVFCHETGCPNSRKVWDDEDGWVDPAPEINDDWDDEGSPFDWDDQEDDWEDRMEDLGPTGHGDICYSDADPGL